MSLIKPFFSLYVISLDIKYREFSFEFLTNPFIICCKKNGKPKFKRKKKKPPRRRGVRAVKAKTLLEWSERAAGPEPQPQNTEQRYVLGNRATVLAELELPICVSKFSLASL